MASPLRTLAFRKVRGRLEHMIAPPALFLVSLLAAPPGEPPPPLCVKREPCRVVETKDAGKDTRGQPMQVAHLTLGWMELEAGAAQEGRAFAEGSRQAQAAAPNTRCEAQEWWLVRTGLPAQLLLSLCNGHQGAVREESVEVLDNLVAYTRSGVRRSDHWTQTRRLRLSPLRMANEDEQTFWESSTPRTGRDNEGDTRAWNYETLQGMIGRAASDCAATDPSVGERELPYLPEVQVDQAFLDGGWKQVGLGQGKGGCHLAARYTLLGDAELPGAKDAGLKALVVWNDAQVRTLILEVRDDQWTGPSAKWLNDDHLELWLAPLPPQVLNGCTKPTAEQRPVQWGIRLVDGKVFPAFGNPKQPLKVERAPLAGNTGYRLKVTLPIEFQALSVLYSDNDGGKKQEKRVATSPLKFGRPETFNPLYRVLPAEATCAAKDGELRVVPGPELKPAPEQAVFQLKPGT